MRKELAQPEVLKHFISNAGPTQQYDCPASVQSIHGPPSGTVTPNRLLFGPHFSSEGAQGEGRHALLQRQLQISSCWSGSPAAFPQVGTAIVAASGMSSSTVSLLEWGSGWASECSCCVGAA